MTMALQAIILAIIQGITELFPISSLGHAVVIPDLLNWNIREDDPSFLPFLVVMHFGTAVAMLLYFWRDWWDFGMAVLFNRGPQPQAERRLFWQVVVATIPAGIVAFIFEKPLKTIFFAHSEYAAAFLIVNGVILFAAERLRRNTSELPKSIPQPGAGRRERSIHQLRWVDALAIGLWQCLALIPGLSRSGTTMVGGFRAGLDHKDAARFSFLTGTPLIILATLHQAPKLLKLDKAAKAAGAAAAPSVNMPLALLAGLVAGGTAFLSLWALMRWFKTHEFKAFDPFAYYCMAAGALSLAYLVFLT